MHRRRRSSYAGPGRSRCRRRTSRRSPAGTVDVSALSDSTDEEDMMARLLDDRLVTEALVKLDEWSGDSQRISRTVVVDDPDALLAAVAESADAMNHHPEVARDGSTLT